MLIIGHELIPYEKIYKVTNISQIKKTPSNSTILFDFNNKEVLQYIKDTDVAFCVKISKPIEACLANALGAKYIVSKKDMASKIQKIAEEYMFDTKILCLVENEEEINFCIENFIDGVLYKQAVIRS